MAVAGFVVALIAALFAAGSVWYARTSADAARISADAARDSADAAKDQARAATETVALEWLRVHDDYDPGRTADFRFPIVPWDGESDPSDLVFRFDVLRPYDVEITLGGFD